VGLTAKGPADSECQTGLQSKNMSGPNEEECQPDKAATVKDVFLLEKSPSETKQFADLYPQRRGNRYKFSWGEKAMGYADQEGDRDLCGTRVINAINNEELPLIRLMVSALKAKGCLTDLFERHLSCDICKPGNNVENNGSYDEAFNQIFICSNNVHGSGRVYGTLLRQLIQMFDACTKKYDFKDARHLACTEIRKANLAHCNLWYGIWRPGGTIFIEDAHRACVKDMAKQTLHHLRFVPQDVANKAVEEVFDKCYHDLEPIGRRCHNRKVFDLCDKEKTIFGYE